MKKSDKKTVPFQDYHEETGIIITTDCLYCLEEFTFDTNDIDDTGWISCPECGGNHETKGFI